jgi:hypothetical protein
VLKPPTPPRNLRDTYPFLSEPTCPPELKVLVSDRITLYHTYNDLYPQLRSCDSAEACASVAGRLLDAYLENRLIGKELDHYRDHGQVLGIHPVFKNMKHLRSLASMSVVQLMERKRKVEQNIWRVGSELRKGNKPHLEQERRQRLQAYKQELNQINGILKP